MLKLRWAGRAALAMSVLALPLVFTACGKADSSAGKLTPLDAEGQVVGTAIDTRLTACGPEPGKAGTCEGTLTVKPSDAGAPPIAVQVTRDVSLLKSGQPVFLPQLRGASVTVRYRPTKEGVNLATSVVAQ